MKKSVLLILSLAVMGVSGESNRSSYTTSPLSVYSGGVGLGSLYAVNDPLNDESQQFLNLAFKNRMFLTEFADLTLDANWFLPGNNFGGDLGLDLFPLGASTIRPFVGFALGTHYFGKESQPFGKGLGTSGLARAGLMVELSERTSISLTVPFYFIANDARDQLVGINIGFHFSDGLRHIRKLNFY